MTRLTEEKLLGWIGIAGNACGAIAVLALPLYYLLDAFGIGGIVLAVVGAVGLMAALLCLGMFVGILLAAAVLR